MTPPTLELALDPADARKLWRHPGVQALGTSRPRSVALSILWHDTTAGALAGRGLALAERRGQWRLERLVPANGEWPPGTPAPILAEGQRPDLLGRALLGRALDGPGLDTAGLDGTHLPVAAFAGRQRMIMPADGEGELTATLLDGTLRGLSAERRCARLTLAGPAAALVGLAEQLVGEFRLRVPGASLAAEALALSRGAAPEPPLGAPSVAPGSPVADAFAHVAGHLTGAILHWSATAGHGASPEPVHQMRVAVRRLRSACAVFRPAVAGPTLNRLQGELRDLAARLGAARDWDVFLEETAAPVQKAFGDDRRLKHLADAARRRRGLAYAALGEYLAGPRFRLLGLHLAGLAALRLWESDVPPEQSAILAGDVAGYASRLLEARRRRMVKAGKRIEALPFTELHELRKRGKKLRYACEFFGDLYPARPTKRFLRRLAHLQEKLGHLNDSATAATLMAELGPGRGFATGAVQGFLAAHGTDLREDIQGSWMKFRRQRGFWA